MFVKKDTAITIGRRYLKTALPNESTVPNIYNLQQQINQINAGILFDIIIGSAAQKAAGSATYTLTDIFNTPTLITSNSKVLQLRGTNALPGNITIAANNVFWTIQSMDAIIDCTVSNFQFNFSGNGNYITLVFTNVANGKLGLAGNNGIYSYFMASAPSSPLNLTGVGNIIEFPGGQGLVIGGNLSVGITTSLTIGLDFEPSFFIQTNVISMKVSPTFNPISQTSYFGFDNIPIFPASFAITGNAINYYSKLTNNGGTIANWFDFYADGLAGSNIAGVTNSYGFYTNKNTGFSFYGAGSAPASFGGNVTIVGILTAGSVSLASDTFPDYTTAGGGVGSFTIASNQTQLYGNLNISNGDTVTNNGGLFILGTLVVGATATLTGSGNTVVL